MSGIRVTYAGLISFVTGLVSVITGIIFTLIVTRQLTAVELGTWSLIGGLVSYVIIIESTISYWTTREIARGKESGRTALLSSGIVSIFALLIYLVIIHYVAPQSKINSDVLLYGSILIPVMFLFRILSAINYGWKPHSLSITNIVFEIVKIPLGFYFVYIEHMSVIGAIISITIAYAVSIVILAIYAKDKLKNKVNLQFLKKWFRLSWLSLYPEIPGLLSKLDILVFTLVTGMIIGISYYTAAITIASLVVQAGSISRAVYPKLLEAGNKNEFLSENLIRLFYFIIPLTAISFVFVRPALFALNPIYEIATQITILVIVKTLFNTLSSVFYPILTGAETVDVDENSKFRDYTKSKLFSLPTFQIVQYSVYIIALFVGLVLLKTNSQLEQTTFWAAIMLICEIPLTVYLYKTLRKNFTIKLDRKSLVKYLVTSISVFSIMYVVTDHFLEYKKSIFEFLPNLLLFVMIGVFAYIIITYFIDDRTKSLFSAIMKEFLNRT